MVDVALGDERGEDSDSDLAHDSDSDLKRAESLDLSVDGEHEPTVRKEPLQDESTYEERGHVAVASTAARHRCVVDDASMTPR
eukprot:7674128-Pyramimonas_sp.AAC.1